MHNFTVIVKHVIHVGHRIWGHKGHKNLHGHTYIVHFYCVNNQLDDLGVIADFDDIQAKLGQWLDTTYDHHMLIYKKDPIAGRLKELDPSTVILPFNPTTENLAEYILTQIGPKLLKGLNVTLKKVIIEEAATDYSAACEL